MGVVFVIFVWLLIFSVFVVVGGAIFLILKILSKRSYVAGVLADGVKSLALVFLCSVVFGVIAVGAATFLDLVSPPRVFFGNFGFAPPSDVSNLSGYRFLLGDSGNSRLEFKASHQTVEKIITGNGFTKTSGRPDLRSDDKRFVEITNAPDVKIYESSSIKNTGFACGKAYLVEDESGGQVYFSWVGID